MSANTAACANWFARPKLGLFLHFGLYAVHAWHEQAQWRQRIPREEYGKLIDRFDPKNLDFERMLDLAQEVGMEYVCLTTKHHDGFCLWDTKHTDFNVMNSPYGRDIVAMLAEACHARDFPLGLYYSVIDWHHPKYPNQNRSHELARPEAGDQPDWQSYKDFLIAQARELCTNYGKISHFFWDMNVTGDVDPSINELLRELQPEVVINNRGFDEGDFGTPEREYQADETGRLTRFPRPTEACNSVGSQSWGYREKENYYSTSFLISSLDSFMAKGANYLLNVGPDAMGQFPDVATGILREVGQWYTKVREAFEGTEPASDLISNHEVLLTRRDNTLYIHVPAPATTDAVLLPPCISLPKRALLLNTGKELTCSMEKQPLYFENEGSFLVIHGLPRDQLSSETFVIRLEFEAEILFGEKDNHKPYQG